MSPALLGLALASTANAQDAAPTEPVAEAPAIDAADAPPPPTDPLYDRLLGDANPEPVLSSVAAAPGPTTGLLAGLWPLGLAAIGAGLVWVARKRVPALGAPNGDGPWVVGRASLGTGAGSVVVVDVRDAAGRTRRLLVSTGSGTPALLADLGEDTRDEAAERALDQELERGLDRELERTAARNAARSPVQNAASVPAGIRGSSAPESHGPTAIGRARTAAYAAFSGTTLDTTDDPPSASGRRRASNLFDEVVGARRGRANADDDEAPPVRDRSRRTRP